ncbi:patatin-like phospholipase family protein [Niveibacterium sp. 24ML]|uniref:patatin-like phospholipase family protein n=1 Tax=Niveibacterium sp. 24ML TaxID=2985512 RepID=UPI002270E851|nr:patatin-like phospholipase family protein [Niveibacterium sp. 24ML]MCX9157402.1 patatin-like phospholipase family protein [Niveibacterium sp. 24ML]
MPQTASDFIVRVEPVLTELRAKGLHQRVYSDVIDDAGHQYVDLVMEGGGVLGVALLGYVYVLEQAGLRFSGLGGASAGSITALALAALGAPAVAKSERLTEIVANMPMESFVDGKDDEDDDAPDFINTMLKRPGLAKGLWKAMQVVDNMNEIHGLNRGARFHAWMRDIVLGDAVASTTALRRLMGTTPAGWRLRDGTRHRASQLEGRDALPPLDPAKDYLCVVAADIATETKVEFPRMADLYWADVGAVNPADYARCSMSIPLFFAPVRVPLALRDAAHVKRWEDMAGLVADDNIGFPPPEAVFVDGGVLSNFPIDAFHSTHKVPTRPTFGVKLQWDERAHTITGPLKLITQTFNASRHCLDYEFIRKNPDFRQLVAYIDTADHDWLNFRLSDEAKLDLFERGAKAALDFLEGFDWERYKDTRASLIGAYQESWRPQTVQV